MTAIPLTIASQDAARLHALEEALADARERLNDFLEISSDWIWETDRNLRFSSFSGRLEQTTGMAPYRWLGHTPEELAIDRDGTLPRGFAEIAARAPFRDLCYRVATPGGERHIRLSGKPLHDASGAFRGYRGSGSDVTDAVEAERRAQTNHRRFAEAIESVPASLLLCDADDRIVICNSVTQRYFPKVAHLLVPGMRFEDLVRAQAESGFLPEAVGNEDAWLAERMKRHRAADTTLLRQYEDGRWVHIIERRTSEGGIIGVRIDITTLKERERVLDEQAARIAEHAKELERSNRELEQFAYIASHDLQEPLRMVASYCQLLRRRYAGKLDQDADEFIEFAVEGASRMQRLINDLLGYSRIGRSNAGIVAFPAKKAVETALANLQAAIEDTGAQIELGTLPTVAADPTQIAQLFQNLIGNAIKFRREEPLVVRVEACPEPAAETGGASVRFTVADNGIGIEQEYLERVFLIFQRLHERGKYPGTGIGLAVAKKVIDNHGGRIWIESTPGAGSRFHFTLPAAETHASTRDTP
jgi:PAS domain S-box-containing protein